MTPLAGSKLELRRTHEQRRHLARSGLLAPPAASKDTPIGCIGSGFIIADCHLVAYRRAGFNPVAIASRSPDHAGQVARSMV